jgi:acetyl-CoA C-acetyltransferase
MNQKVYILDSIRTPLGNFGGALKDYSAVDLGAALIRELIIKSGLPNRKPDGVIVGNVLQAGLGQNPARQCALNAGLSPGTACLTVNKVCGSGMKAIDIAYRNIASGYGSLYLSGGIESMTNSPYLSRSTRWGSRLGNNQLADEMIIDGLWCPFNNRHMGEITEDLAADYGITRKQQDFFSYESNMKAVSATKEGRFSDEILPVEIMDKKSGTALKDDERPREDTTPEKLAVLKPVFKKDGTVTAGNSSGINDGAAMLIVASGSAVKKYDLDPAVEIISFAEVGVKPELFGIAPVKATRKALADAGMDLKDIELFELNEAFAAQSLCVLKDLKIDKDIVNVNGGAIALGHPIGASGTRITVTLIHEMIRREVKYGAASLCIGSGEAMTVILKNIKS